MNSTDDLGDAMPGDGVCASSSGSCTLRAAIDEVNAGAFDHVRILLPTAPITLSLVGTDDTNVGGDLDMDANATAVDIWANDLFATITSSTAERLIDVHSGDVRLQRLALVDAAHDVLRVNAGSVHVQQVSISRNEGIAISVMSGAEIAVDQSTVAENTGIGMAVEGTATVAFTTVARNGGGVSWDQGTYTALGSIVGEHGVVPDCSALVSSLGGNIDSDGSCWLDHESDLAGVDPMLAPLSETPLPNVSPGVGSPAIDRLIDLSQACPATQELRDQRGVLRPLREICDSGSVEVPDGPPQFLFEYGENGTGPGQWWAPVYATEDAAGNIVIGESGRRVVMVHDADGNLLFEFGGVGTEPGQLETLTDMAVDLDGNLHIIDQTLERVQVFDPSGSLLRAYAGPGGHAQGLAIDHEGRIHLPSPGCECVAVYDSAGTRLYDYGMLGYPRGIAVDQRGNMQVVDKDSATVNVFTPEGETSDPSASGVRAPDSSTIPRRSRSTNGDSSTCPTPTVTR